MLPFTRPVKFVSNEMSTHLRRKRITIACRTCRKRKTRCTGEKPTCDTCKNHGQECLGYPEQVTRSNTGHSRYQGRRVDGGFDDVGDLGSPTPSAIPALGSPSRHHQRRASQPAVLPSQLPTDGSPRGPNMKIESPCYRSPDWEFNLEYELEDLFRGDGSQDKALPSLSMQQRPANKVPYFRYFGPTAIVPGYKQMVVEVRGSRPGASEPSPPVISGSPVARSPPYVCRNQAIASQAARQSSAVCAEDTPPPPVYDPDDTAVHPLIVHLVDLFFFHMGCQFPFLHRVEFTRDVEARRADAMLVDAVCAISARFSKDPLLQRHPPSSAGVHFANRAKSVVVDTFACPSLSAVQACLLLAYAEFGSNRDSGLWVFLGCAIRMAQDLGLHKLAGMRGERRGRSEERRRARSRSVSPAHKQISRKTTSGGPNEDDSETVLEDEPKKEKQRTDTFWAVYFLDRVISSGTGRPVTLKDREIEIDMPSDEISSDDDWYPQPFPALMCVIRLYGRATDLLNNVDEVSSAPAKPTLNLSEMESDLNRFFKQISPKLHFNVGNFRYYVQTNQASVFLLLHFWFHALVALLHRPKLFIGFDGRIRQLFPNSHELSMSSAKTIVDMISFAESLDIKAVTCTPFCTQPIYIAACVFLEDSAEHAPKGKHHQRLSHSASPAPTFSLRGLSQDGRTGACSPLTVESDTSKSVSQEKFDDAQRNTDHSSHILLHSSRSSYQQCYKSLKAIEPFWQGVKYILTVLDQKAQGIVDPLLYTDEEMESVDARCWQSGVWNRFTGGLKGEMSAGSAVLDCQDSNSQRNSREIPSSQGFEGLRTGLNQAICMSVTGFTDSTNQTLSFIYPTTDQHHRSSTSIPHRLPMVQNPSHIYPMNSYSDAGIRNTEFQNPETEILHGLSSTGLVSPPHVSLHHASQTQLQSSNSTFYTRYEPVEMTNCEHENSGMGMMFETQDYDINAPMLGFEVDSFPATYISGDASFQPRQGHGYDGRSR